MKTTVTTLHSMVSRKNRKPHSACETSSGKKVLKLAKLYKVNYVWVNMSSMYKLLCITCHDHHSKFFIVHFHYVNYVLKVGMPCSSTAATSRKQVTKRLYFIVFILILYSSGLNESLRWRHRENR